MLSVRTLIVLSFSVVMSFSATAFAGTSTDESGTLVCVNDKWEEKVLDDGTKVADYAGPCINIPADPAAERFVEDCTGKYEFKPDDTWKGSGTCTLNLKDGHITSAWEEGSDLKEYTYKYTGGDGKYKGAGGSGTYKTDNLSDRFAGGHFKGKMELP